MLIKATILILWVVRIYMVIVTSIAIIVLSLLLAFFNFFAMLIHTKWINSLILKCLKILE